MPEDRSIPDETTAPDEDTAHPAGEIRLSPARSVGLRVAALGGLAVGAIIAATPVMPALHPTSGP